MGLPGHFHNKTYGQSCFIIGAAKSVYNIESLARKLRHRDGFKLTPYFWADWFIVIFNITIPPQRVFGGIIQCREFIFWRPACILTSQNIHSAKIADLATFVTFKICVCFMCVERIITRIVDNLLSIFNANRLKICLYVIHLMKSLKVHKQLYYDK